MEYIDVLDEKGNRTGKSKPRMEVHRDGDWHRSVHIWFVNSQKEVLLQRRSKDLEIFPDKWHISVGGHIESGEDEISAVLREIKEEIGIDISNNEFKKVGEVVQQGILNNGTYFDNEFDSIYMVQKDLELLKLSQTKEVSCLIWLPIAEFKKWVMEKNPELAPQPKEYPLIIKFIEEDV